MTKSRDRDLNRLMDGHRQTNPFFCQAPEFVLDGQRGLGKTSVLLPMMMAVAGVIDYPFKASIRRRVFYVTEDIEQARRIIAAIHKHGLITVDGRASKDVSAMSSTPNFD